MTARLPNILFITTDHLRFDTLGCNGDSMIRTPNIDALADDGVNFQNMFVQSPVCMPSRACFMTGRYPSAHGVKWNSCPLHEWEVPLTEVLKKMGYTIALVGKDHVHQDRYEKTLDEMRARRIRNMRPDNPFVQYVKEQGYDYVTGFALPNFVERLGAVPSDQPESCHLDAYVGEQAVDYLTHRNDNRPFFLWTGFYGPHHPYVPAGDFATMYDPDSFPPFDWREEDIARKPPEYRIYREWQGHKFAGFDKRSEATYRQMKAAYYGTVSLIDKQIGRIIQVLRDKGLYDDTLIIFTSDHGDFLGEHKMPAKGPFLLDSLLHVPLIVKAPKSPGAGRLDTSLRESVDIYPTILDFLGAEIPPHLQGRSFRWAFSADPTDPNPREYVYAEAINLFSLRSRKWKYIHYAGRPYGELYDLETDPGEMVNLYAELPEKVHEMRQALWDYRDRFVTEHAHPHFAMFSGTDPLTGKELTHYGTW